MESSVLHPPNIHTLSDGVIGDVIPSSLWPKPGDDDAWSSNTPSYASPRPQYFQQLHDSVDLQTPPPTWSARATAPIKHKGMLNSSKNTVGRANRTDEKLLLSKTKALRDIRRQRGRASMQRHRKKLQDHTISVERDVGKLREETQKLQLQCQTLSYGVPTGISALTVVAEYFRLFHYGLKSSAKTNDHGSSTKLATSAQVSSVQRDFLKAAVSPDVAGETGFGVEKLIEDYRRLARYLPDTDTQLVRLDTDPDDSLTATTTVAIVITASMLHCTFPHLVNGGDRDQWSPLAVKFLDHLFVLRGSIQFKWDSTTRRLKLVQSRADFLTPMLQLLGDLRTVSRVFDKALITPECKLR